MSDYSKLVKETAINDKNINQNISDVKEYSNILTGNTSTMLNSPIKTLGRVYAYDTTETCVDYNTLKQVPRHSVSNSMPNWWEGGLLNSAKSDFQKSKADINYVVNAEKFPMKCMSVPIIETDIYGRSTTNSYYIMIAEIDKLSYNLFPGNKKPSLPTASPIPKDKFVNMEEETLDAGQTFFIGSLGVIGLYMYFKMVYGHSK
jgi:hypothetical protein